MAFLKAFQNQQKPEGYEEYIAALIRYKRACANHKNILNRLERRMDAAARLLRADSKEVFKQECKIYTSARTKYKVSLANQEMKARGLDTSVLDIAKSLDIALPTGMKQMIAENKANVRREAAIQSMGSEKFEELKKAALENIEKIRKRNEQEVHNAGRHKTKNDFMESGEQDDPTFGDFDPI